jgi:hypothetical protein
MHTTEPQLIQPTLDLALCVNADTCAAELKRCADEADRCAALAQAGAELAIRHAINAGIVANQAKEIIPHGEFLPWLETNAYIATGILPEPEPTEGGTGDKDRPPFVLSFKCSYRLPSEWQRDAARDFLYEFERLAKLAVQLKTEFGL